MYLLRTGPDGNLLWQKTYGREGTDWGQSVDVTSDGGYVITGSTNSFSPATNVYLLKTDRDGELIWETTFGGVRGARGRSVEETADGGYIVAGSRSSLGAGDQAYVVKLTVNASRFLRGDCNAVRHTLRMMPRCSRAAGGDNLLAYGPN